MKLVPSLQRSRWSVRGFKPSWEATAGAEGLLVTFHAAKADRTSPLRSR